MRKNEHVFYYTPENAFVKRGNGVCEAKSLARGEFPELHHRPGPAVDFVPVADQFHLFAGVGVVFLVRAGVNVAGNDVLAVLHFQQREAEAGEIGLLERMERAGDGDVAAACGVDLQVAGPVVAARLGGDLLMAG